MPVESTHGRGATRNSTPTRFNLKERVEEGEWLDTVEALDGKPKRRTTVTIEHPRTILTRNASPDIGFDRSVNPYRGCEHGCIYCFARPTHAYHDLSPGVDFESRLFVKPSAAALLHQALSRPGYQCAPIALGTNTDPYQPIEERWKITRSVIELLLECRHPFTITTKSDRVLRDLDILKPAAATTTPISSAGCAGPGRGQTCLKRVSRSPPRNMVSGRRGSRFAGTCSSRRRATSCGFCDFFDERWVTIGGHAR